MLSTLTLTARVTRSARKEINPALHRAGLPTLGAHETLGSYRKALTKAQRDVLAGMMGAQEKPARKAQAWTCACTSVREHIRASKDGHAAQTAALFAQVA